MKKIGLVLAGGGARGGYEIGALKALEELGFKYDVITGTSVGAINAFMLLSNKKDVLFEMWNTIDYEAVVDHKYTWKNKSLETIIKAPFHNGFALTPLEKLINDRVVCIGEIGLDYHWSDDKDNQKFYFKEFIKLAYKYNLPICIHCREA